MSHSIQNIEGVGPTFAKKLAKAGIRTTEALLDMCGSPKGRHEVAKITGFHEPILLRWTNFADLMRVSGVGEEYSELLEAAGVDTVKELARRNPGRLCMQLEETNKKRNHVRKLPAESQVMNWVHQAKKMPRCISY